MSIGQVEGEELAFGDFVLDRGDERLIGPHGPVRLGNKAFRVLLQLAEQEGRMLTKDALFSSVWDGKIVSESALTAVIKELRRALGDESRTPRYIESIYGRGYRLIAAVTNEGQPPRKKSGDNLSSKLEEVIARLGLDQDKGLVRSWGEFTGTNNRHIVRQAFDAIGARAVFGFTATGPDRRQSFTPILYLCAAPDDSSAKEIHRSVWSQSVVPLLLVATPAGLQIRRSLAPPPERPINIPWETIANSETLPHELTSLTAVALRSSIVWRDFAIDRSRRVDKVLLDGILSLSDTLQPQGEGIQRSVIHAVIGRFLYFYILLDRNIIDARWISGLTSPEGSALCPAIAESLGVAQNAHAMWPAREVWALFDSIDEVMNGAIFPVTQAQRKEVSNNVLHQIHRVIRHGDRISSQGRQLSFLDISFSTLRTETISAIYELFLALECEDTKSDEGAFYTPPFLVDYVLDEVDRIEPFGKASRVLDPAAGSGIFLVGCYRRILERALTRTAWTAQHFNSSRKLLEQNIFGVERNPQAANVCRFSLYLTLLDYISGASITALAKLAGGDRVFPPLSDNILSRDIFEVAEKGAEGVGRFTHVVGNPPWGTYGDNASRTNAPPSRERQQKIARSMEAAIAFHGELNALEYPVTNKRLSELFMWKIKRDLLAEDGVLGILLSTRSFVSRTASAFPSAVATQFALVGIANLSHFRYRLFAQARSPTLAIFARNAEPDPMDEVWVYSPLLSSQPIGETGHLWSIIMNAGDVETHRLRDLCRSAESWFDHLILRSLDRKHARHLKLWTERTANSLGAFLASAGMRMSRGGSPTQTGLPERLLLKSNFREALGLDGLGFSSYPHEELARHDIAPNFRPLFSGNVLLIPRSMNEAVFIKQSVAYSSTFNAVFSPDGSRGREYEKLLTAMAAFLASQIAHYFYALFGKSWILDHARLEKHDLEAVPFPIDGTGDEALDVLLSGDQQLITRTLAERMGLDSSFVDTVGEYADFRSGYEDSQLPPASLRRPGGPEVDRYQAMLAAELRQIFGSRATASVDVFPNVGEDYFAELFVQIARRGNGRKIRGAAAPHFSLTGQFNPHSTIWYDPIADGITITKPWTHVAWTIEQAFADARGVSAAILRSEAAA